MDLLSVRVKMQAKNESILCWLSGFLRYTAKLDKYNSLAIIKFVRSTLEKKIQFLDQRQLFFNLLPYLGDATVTCICNIVRLIQFSNNKHLMTYKLSKLSGIENKLLYEKLSENAELMCLKRERGGDEATCVVFGKCYINCGWQSIGKKDILIEKSVEC